MGLLLIFVPTALIGIILMWAKKVPKNAFVRVIATVVFGLIFVFWASGMGGSSDQPSDKNPQVISNVNVEDANETEDNNDNKSKEKVFKKGDVVETSDLRITFVSAKKYKSDNEFIKPKKGNVYYRMEFEFDNIGDSDETISSIMSWTCYADSYKAEQAYIGEDEIDGTISPGKKIKGGVYFEIQKDAKEITLAYECNFLTEDKVVFKVK